MNTCKNCEAENPETNIYCYSCGIKLNNDTPQNNTSIAINNKSDRSIKVTALIVLSIINICTIFYMAISTNPIIIAIPSVILGIIALILAIKNNKKEDAAFENATLKSKILNIIGIIIPFRIFIWIMEINIINFFTNVFFKNLG